MIIEEVLEFEYDKNSPIKISLIEEFIKSKNIDPIRFSLIMRVENKIFISVSGIQN